MRWLRSCHGVIVNLGGALSSAMVSASTSAMDRISVVLTLPASSMALRATSMTWLMSSTSLTAWLIAAVALMSLRRMECSRVMAWYWLMSALVGVLCMALAR